MLCLGSPTMKTLTAAPPPARRRPTANRAGPAIARGWCPGTRRSAGGAPGRRAAAAPSPPVQGAPAGPGAALQVVHVDRAARALRSSYSAQRSARAPGGTWRRAAGQRPADLRAALISVSASTALSSRAPLPRLAHLVLLREGAAQVLSKSLACSSAVAAFCAVVTLPGPASGPAPAAGARSSAACRAGSNAGRRARLASTHHRPGSAPRAWQRRPAARHAGCGGHARC